MSRNYALDGKKREKEFVRLLNSNKKNTLWSDLNIDDPYQYYIVHVSSNHFSRISQKNVSPKSDAFIVRGDIQEDFFKKQGYFLNESSISSLNLQVIENSGISIKMEESKKYTIQKFTFSTFCKFFEKLKTTQYGADYLFLSLLLYDNDKNKNIQMAESLGINYENFIKEMGITNVCSHRKKAQQILRQYIQDNTHIAEAIFLGKHIFDDPYWANYLYAHGKLKPNTIPEKFVITTGSGRSRGEYTIEIKP